MATVIRLARHGRKKLPFYHLVVADKRQARDGRVIEQLGHYDPLSTANEGKGQWSFNKERAAYWLSQGAQVSPRVERMFIKEGLGSEKQRQQWENRFAARKAGIQKTLEAARAKVAKAEAAEAAKAAAEAKAAADAAAAAAAEQAAASESAEAAAE